MLMTKPEINAASAEYVYKEYVRLSDRCASYVQSAFDDIKLLGLSGLVFAWTPIVEYLKLDEAKKTPVLFYGFLTILLVVIVIGLYSLIKQSIVIYYLKHLRTYETEIRADFGDTNKGIFEWAQSYSEWRKTIVLKIFLHLQAVVCLAIVVFPVVSLAYVQRAYSYAAIYLVVSASLLGVFVHAARVILKE